MRDTAVRILKIGRWILTVFAVLFLTIYFGWAFESRRMLQLQPEHRITFDAEFRARDEDETDWQDYLAIEDRLAQELDETIHDSERPGSVVDRYAQYRAELVECCQLAASLLAWQSGPNLLASGSMICREDVRISQTR